MPNYFLMGAPWRFLGIVISVCFVLLACESVVNDNEPPRISEVTPTEGQTLYIGGNNEFRATFSDNEGLSSYMIYINAVDGTEDRPDSLWLDFKKTGNKVITSQREVSVVQLLNIPETQQDTTQMNTYLPVVPGKYNMKVVCMDMAGNRDSLVCPVTLVYAKDAVSLAAQ